LQSAKPNELAGILLQVKLKMKARNWRQEQFKAH